MSDAQLLLHMLDFWDARLLLTLNSTSFDFYFSRLTHRRLDFYLSFHSPRHNHNGTPCRPEAQEAAGTSRTVEAEEEGLNERDRWEDWLLLFLLLVRFSLFQQKYRSLETGQGFLLLDSKERQRIYGIQVLLLGEAFSFS